MDMDMHIDTGMGTDMGTDMGMDLDMVVDTIIEKEELPFFNHKEVNQPKLTGCHPTSTTYTEKTKKQPIIRTLGHFSADFPQNA